MMSYLLFKLICKNNLKYKLSVNTLFALFCSLNNFFSWGFVCLFRFIIMFNRVINSAAETSKKIPPPQKKKSILIYSWFSTFFKWFSLRFLKTFYQKINFAADFSQTFTTPMPFPDHLQTFLIFPCSRKITFHFVIIYITTVFIRLTALGAY